MAGWGTDSAPRANHHGCAWQIVSYPGFQAARHAPWTRVARFVAVLVIGPRSAQSDSQGLGHGKAQDGPPPVLVANDSFVVTGAWWPVWSAVRCPHAPSPGTGGRKQVVFVVGAVALVIILWLLLRRRDSRAATIRSLPKYGTTEATELQKAIVDQGPAALVSPHSGPSTLLAIEPARGEDYFRARLGNGGRPPIPPVAKLRRARSKPVRPKPFAAPRARPGFAPPQTVLVPASRCRICSRPLTNSESRRRGVGPDCYRSYGPRVVHAANPAFAEWSDRKGLMDAQQAAWQALLDELYQHLMQRFETEMRNWDVAGRVAA